MEGRAGGAVEGNQAKRQWQTTAALGGKRWQRWDTEQELLLLFMDREVRNFETLNTNKCHRTFIRLYFLITQLLDSSCSQRATELTPWKASPAALQAETQALTHFIYLDPLCLPPQAMKKVFYADVCKTHDYRLHAHRTMVHSFFTQNKFVCYSTRRIFWFSQ